jgi:IclR family transcriptional regulator, KDG regulon repressor
MAGKIIKSLERGLMIMDILGRSRGKLSLNEISEHFDLDRASVFRLLTTLIKHGYVAQDLETKRYYLGYKILEHSAAITGYTNIESSLRPIMRRVCAETRQNTHCAALDGREVVFIAVELPRDTVTVHISIGTREPAAATALGRAIIPFLLEREFEQLLSDETLPGYTEKSLRRTEDLRQVLLTVRKTKVAVDDEEYKDGIICFAAPVFDQHGKVICSIGISGHKDSIRPNYDEFAEIIRQAGLEASRQMGWSPQ